MTTRTNGRTQFSMFLFYLQAVLNDVDDFELRELQAELDALVLENQATLAYIIRKFLLHARFTKFEVDNSKSPCIE